MAHLFTIPFLRVETTWQHPLDSQAQESCLQSQRQVRLLGVFTSRYWNVLVSTEARHFIIYIILTDAYNYPCFYYAREIRF